MIKKLLQKPHLFFFGLIPIFIFIAFFKGNEPLDINIHDTYFITDVKFWSLISAIFFCLIGFNYLSLQWAEKPPKKWLTIAHIFLQLLAFLLLLTKNNWSWIGKQYPKEFQYLNDNSETIVVVSLLIFILSVFIHLINFFVSLLLKNQ